MNNTMKCSNFLGQSFLLEKRSGKVISKDHRTETKIHGGGGNGSPISSSVVNKSTVWLLDQDGKEFTWNLTNTNLGVRESHVMSCAVTQKGSAFFAGYNHNLEKFELWDGALSKYLSPPLLIGWAIVLLPIVLLWTGCFFDGCSLTNVANFSVGIFIGWGLAVLFLWAIFVYVRRLIFTLRYKQKIINFLSETVVFNSPRES